MQNITTSRTVHIHSISFYFSLFPYHFSLSPLSDFINSVSSTPSLNQSFLRDAILYSISALITLFLLNSLTQAVPVSTSTYPSFPTFVPQDQGRLLLSNGFPNPSPSALQAIEQAAGGTLSNIPATKNVTNPDSLTNFQLVAFNELFEVAFFTDLLQNVTNKLPGYEIPKGYNETFIIETLKTVQAQEQLHALNANARLPTPIQPCAYTFPVTTLESAISLAATFTDVVLGTLQDIATVFATNNDTSVIRGVTATLGQEGQQSGFYRSFLGKRPSSQPFLTASTRDFAFSALQQGFVVRGSCPNIQDIDLRTFGTLTLITQPTRAKDQTLQFAFDGNDAAVVPSVEAEELKLVLVNAQNRPLRLEIKDMRHQGSKYTFEAEVPIQTELLFGLSVAVLVRGGAGELGTVDAVADAAVFGPALIEVA